MHNQKSDIFEKLGQILGLSEEEKAILLSSYTIRATLTNIETILSSFGNQEKLLSKFVNLPRELISLMPNEDQEAATKKVDIINGVVFQNFLQKLSETLTPNQQIKIEEFKASIIKDQNA